MKLIIIGLLLLFAGAHAHGQTQEEWPIPTTALKLQKALSEAPNGTSASWEVKQEGDIICDTLWWGPPSERFYFIYASKVADPETSLSMQVLRYTEHHHPESGLTVALTDMMASWRRQDGTWTTGSNEVQRRCNRVLAEYPEVVKLEHYFVKY